MAFSLSPSVQVTEQDFSLNVQNLPTSQTGMVIRAEQGPALEIVRITNESDLINNFGTPTARNFKDFFNAWNFLQYSNSLYVVRALASSGKNAGIKFEYGNTISSIEKGDLYNPSIAELTLSTHTASSGVEVYNRYVEHTQKLAIAVCSNSTNWTLPISTELKCTVASGGGTKNSTTLTVASGASMTMASGSYIDFGTIEIPILSIASGAGSTQILTLSSGLPYDIASGTVLRTANYVSSYQTSAGVVSSFKSFFDYEPNWANGEFVYLVFKKNTDGLYDLVEKNLVSYNESAKDVSGNSIFVDNFTYSFSKYIYTKTSATTIPVINTGSSVLTKIRATSNSLCSASDVTQGQVEEAFDKFGDAEEVDINILVNHELSENYASTISENRKDCFTIVAPFNSTLMLGKSASDATTALCEAYGTQTTGTKSFSQFGTYSGIFGNMKYQYDRWNDVNRWVPVHGDVAGLFAQTDSNRDPWWAPAGSERGVMRNVIKLAFNPNKGNRDSLYVNAINPIFSIPGEGQGVVFGQKTATTSPVATDRINVRRLLLTVEKAIAKTARVMIFEFNDDITRSRLSAAINPYLAYVQARRGLYEYRVVVDTTNNTSQIIDSNALVIDIFLKPTKVAEFIQINAKILGSSASISEYTGQA